jgi:hypothetical protein
VACILHVLRPGPIGAERQVAFGDAGSVLILSLAGSTIGSVLTCEYFGSRKIPQGRDRPVGNQEIKQ